MSKRIFKRELAGRPLSIETGQLAQFANGAVLVRYGDTVVLTTVTASSEPREGIDFFPLSVDFEEKMYSVGKMPGGFLRREGRPSEKAVLAARCIDRPIRPLFPKDLRNDVTVNNLILSVDFDCSPEVAATIGTATALSISDIPWNGPAASVQVGLIDDEIIINPNLEQSQASRLDLTVAGTSDKVCMIEAGAQEVPDELMLTCIIAAHREIQELCNWISEITAEIGRPKFSYISAALPQELIDEVQRFAWDEMRDASLSADKAVRDQNVSQLKDKIQAHLESINPDWAAHTAEAVDTLQKKVVRDMLFREERRVDGRQMGQIRDLSAEVDLLPRAHGSALFQRGQTQVLTVCTLATLGNAQKLDGVDPAEKKRYIHHYNFPAYSVGEARPNRSPGRREIGHGALAERALLPVLPDEETFPYAIRTVSEVTMSNGSTSQASVCASTMALMAAGVPISKPVAGISSGLITNDADPNDYKVFMDIQGIEDFFGDMDFKVAGTDAGITAIQVDIKVDGLSIDMIRDAFALTRQGRLQILNEVMLPAIAEPRSELSAYAPKIEMLDIPADKIREVIGSGGKVIRKITEETGAEIDIEEDGPVGHVYIASPNQAAASEAIKRIRSIAFDPEPGTVFEGIVTRLMTFGAFVEIAPGKEGLVHISKMSWGHLNRVEDAVEPGQTVKVVVTEIDAQGRLNLSMRDLMDKPEGYNEQDDEQRGGSRGRGGERRDRRGDGERGDRGGRDRRDRRGGREGGATRDRSERRDRRGGDGEDLSPRARNRREF